jgi:hypothetical protein
MARPAVKPEDQVVETWESTMPGTIYVWLYDRREDKYLKHRVGGKTGSKRLHITRDDRKYNQERVPVENIGHDPFTNGAMRLITAETRDENLDTRYHLSDTDLHEILEIRDVEPFMEAVSDIQSELIIRRLVALAEKDGTQGQNEALKELAEVRYPIGGTQKTVREMIEAGERIGADRI